MCNSISPPRASKTLSSQFATWCEKVSSHALSMKKLHAVPGSNIDGHVQLSCSLSLPLVFSVKRRKRGCILVLSWAGELTALWKVWLHEDYSGWRMADKGNGCSLDGPSVWFI
ncbi:unnamed protein product [Ectocarpus sp. 12 AP-2014]